MHFTYGTGKSKTKELDFIGFRKNLSKETNNDNDTDNEIDPYDILSPLKSPIDYNFKKKTTQENENNSDSDNDKDDFSDYENDATLKNIKQSMDENIFVEMKIRSKQSLLINRKSLLPERRESGLLNQQEINQMDKGYKIIKNTQIIKENKNILKICDVLKFLCVLYVKTGSCIEVPNLKSLNFRFFIFFSFALRNEENLQTIFQADQRIIKRLIKQKLSYNEKENQGNKNIVNGIFFHFIIVFLLLSP